MTNTVQNVSQKLKNFTDSLGPTSLYCRQTTTLSWTTFPVLPVHGVTVRIQLHTTVVTVKMCF